MSNTNTTNPFVGTIPLSPVLLADFARNLTNALNGRNDATNDSTSIELTNVAEKFPHNTGPTIEFAAANRDFTTHDYFSPDASTKGSSAAEVNNTVDQFFAGTGIHRTDLIKAQGGQTIASPLTALLSPIDGQPNHSFNIQAGSTAGTSTYALYFKHIDPTGEQAVYFLNIQLCFLTLHENKFYKLGSDGHLQEIEDTEFASISNLASQQIINNHGLSAIMPKQDEPFVLEHLMTELENHIANTFGIRPIIKGAYVAKIIDNDHCPDLVMSPEQVVLSTNTQAVPFNADFVAENHTTNRDAYIQAREAQKQKNNLPNQNQPLTIKSIIDYLNYYSGKRGSDRKNAAHLANAFPRHYRDLHDFTTRLLHEQGYNLQHALRVQELLPLSEILHQRRQRNSNSFRNTTGQATKMCNKLSQHVKNHAAKLFGQLDELQQKQQGTTFQKIHANVFKFPDKKQRLTVNDLKIYLDFYAENCGFRRRMTGGTQSIKDLTQAYTRLLAKYRNNKNATLDESDIDTLSDIFITRSTRQSASIESEHSASSQVMKNLGEHMLHSIVSMQCDKAQLASQLSSGCKYIDTNCAQQIQQTSTATAQRITATS